LSGARGGAARPADAEADVAAAQSQQAAADNWRVSIGVV
jgi:hypothetical protein